MKNHILVIALLLLSIPALSQTPGVTADELIDPAFENNDVVLETRVGNFGVYSNNIKLSPKEVKDIMVSNPDALAEYNRALNYRTAYWVVGLPSAFVFGWSIADLINGRGDAVLISVGTAGTALGVIMGVLAQKKEKSAVVLYNSGMGSPSLSQLTFGSTSSGIGLSYRF